MMNDMILPSSAPAVTSAEINQAVAAKIVAFLRDIGLEIRTGVLEKDTVLPGINVDHSILVFDPAKLKFPGDLLHEAGHLAVKSPEERWKASSRMSSDPAEEMMAIAWSYAASGHLQFSPEVVFHPDGYRGGSQSLIENFSAGRYLAVPMLQWLGLTCDEKRAKETGAAPYPHMIKWVRTVRTSDDQVLLLK